MLMFLFVYEYYVGLNLGDSQGFKGRNDAMGVAYDLVALPFDDTHGY
jgi:hypothetical protein